jgi:hypothetical protein
MLAKNAIAVDAVQVYDLGTLKKLDSRAVNLQLVVIEGQHAE